MAALGWQGLLFPEEYGGAALSLLELAIVLEEMGRVLLPGPFLGTVIAGLVILRCGSDDQRRRWLPGICDGSVVASPAVIEESASWSPDDVRAAARPAPGGYLLSGTKLFVPDAEIADVVVSVVRLEPSVLGIAVVERAALAGITPLESVDRTRRLAAVALDGVGVDAASRRATPPRSAPCSTRGALRSPPRCAAAPSASSSSPSTTPKCAEQFDHPIGSFQAIQHKCADMLVDVECAKTATTYAAWAAANGAADAAVAAAGAKALASDAYRSVTAEAIQVHGGIGFTWEHDLHLYFKRAMSSEVTFGDATFNRELVARRLGL